MTELFTLSVTHRSNSGRGDSRRLRRQNYVPGVVYGAGIPTEGIAVEHKVLQKALENPAFFSHILTLQVEGNEKLEKVVLKDLERHVYKPKILHVDFQRIRETEKLHMNVPLRIIGESKAPGIQLEGGILTQQTNDIAVLCLPADLPEYIEIDISLLHLNQSLHLSQLTLPKGVESVALSHGDDLALVSIQKPKEEVEEVKVAAEAAPGAEAGAVPASEQKEKEKTPEGSGEPAAKKAGKEGK